MWIYLVINVLLATTIFFLFKWFRIRGIDSSRAIFVNYFVVAALGMGGFEDLITLLKDGTAVISTLILGVMFIAVFNIMAKTSQQSGITIASIASKMSVIIPVVAGIVLYGESVGFLKITGILLAIAAIIRVSWKGSHNTTSAIDFPVVLLPLLLFIGSGIVDSLLKFIQNAHMGTHPLESLLTLSSIFAGIAGLFYTAITKGAEGIRLDKMTILYGVILGLVNYGSLFSILKVLDDNNIESGIAFSVINVSVVSLSAIFARLIFKERLGKGQIFGLVIAIVAILFLNLS